MACLTPPRCLPGHRSDVGRDVCNCSRIGNWCYMSRSNQAGVKVISHGGAAAGKLAGGVGLALGGLIGAGATKAALQRTPTPGNKKKRPGESPGNASTDHGH